MIPLTEALINKNNIKNASTRCDFFICTPKSYASDKKLYKHFELQFFELNNLNHAYILTSEEVKQAISLVGLGIYLYTSKREKYTKRDILADFKKVVNNPNEDWTIYFEKIEPKIFN